MHVVLAVMDNKSSSQTCNCDEEHDRDGTRRVMSDGYYRQHFGGYADAFKRMDESVREAQLTVKRMRRRWPW